MQSGVNVQYVLAGLKRRTNPLPVKSRTDSPPSQQPGVASPHSPAQQRMSPSQQSMGRTPTPPVQNQGPPARNLPKQQSMAVSQQTPPSAMPRTYDQRSTPQVSGVNHQQLPGMGRLPRRPGIPGQGAMPPNSDQVSDHNTSGRKINFFFQ